MAKKKSFVDVAAAKSRGAYKEVLQQIEKDGVCPFCPQYFVYHSKPILFDGTYWLVTENIAPYAGTRVHLLFLHKKHIEHIAEASPEAWEELRQMIGKATKRFRISGGSFFMRFGDKHYTGATVTQHLHAQLIVGSRQSSKTEKLKVTLGHKKISPRE